MNSNSPSIQLEWLFETLNKRLDKFYGIKLEDLFLIVPFRDEAEFDFELGEVFKVGMKAYGNDLKRDYPNICKLLNNSNKKVTLRVFFLSPSRVPRPVILWHKKFDYPKISLGNSKTQVLDFSHIDKNIALKEYLIKKSKLDLS